MKHLLLALAFCVAAVAPVLPAMAASHLGDLTALSTIANDTLGITPTGDLHAAELRITDFESAWDADTTSMQPLNPEEWAVVDHAADLAIASLRAPAPVQDDAAAAIKGLIAALDDPAAGSTVATSAAAAIAFPIANADGSPLPCEVALKTLRDAQTGKKPTDQAQFDTLMNKGLERCNADDDKRADGFFADAFALL